MLAFIKFVSISQRSLFLSACSLWSWAMLHIIQRHAPYHLELCSVPSRDMLRMWGWRPRVGADPCVCPLYGKGFVIVRAYNLPQPLRRRVAIGSAPTSWMLISCFPSQFRFLGLTIQVLLYSAIWSEARTISASWPVIWEAKRRCALYSFTSAKLRKKVALYECFANYFFQKTFFCVSRFSVSVLERVFAYLRKNSKYI